jgi:hypothetical protein
MGRTYRKDDEHNFGFRNEKRQRPKKNKHRKSKKDSYGHRYNVTGVYEDHDDDDPRFEKFTNAKRKDK